MPVLIHKHGRVLLRRDNAYLASAESIIISVTRTYCRRWWITERVRVSVCSHCFVVSSVLVPQSRLRLHFEMTIIDKPPPVADGSVSQQCVGPE